MEFLMNILRAIASIRCPLLDTLFSLITHIGEETVFLALAIIVFWCVDKRQGYFVLVTSLFGVLLQQAGKLILRIPRPWVIDPDFPVVESAIAEATGYSCPSGHTMNTACSLGTIAAANPKKKWLSITLTVTIALVAFSRMYLGVHTLLDVGLSLVLALGVVLLLRPVFATQERFDKLMPVVTVVGVLTAILYFIFALIVSSDTTLDPENVKSGLKNGATILGATLGLIPTYLVDRFYTKFETRGAWYVQLIKLIVGIAIVLGIKSGLSSPLVSLFGNEYVARAVRYFLVVIFAGVLWPMSFKYLRRLENLKN